MGGLIEDKTLRPKCAPSDKPLRDDDRRNGNLPSLHIRTSLSLLRPALLLQYIARAGPKSKAYFFHAKTLVR